MHVTASAPASPPPRDVDDPVGVRAQLRPAGTAAARRRGDDLWPRDRVVGEDRAAALQVRARQVDLDRDDARGRGGEEFGRPAVVVDGPAPDAGDHGRPGRLEVGTTCSSQYSMPGPLQADRVEHPLCRGVQPGRRIAVPGERGERLRDDRADRREIERGRELRAVPGGARAVITGEATRPNRSPGVEVDGAVTRPRQPTPGEPHVDRPRA